MIPQDLHYSSDHEWIRPAGPDAAGNGDSDTDTVRIGITDYAQNSLGDIVFVQLPELGTTVATGDALGEVESTKSVSDVFAPVSGTVVARNDALDSTPELVNSDPYGDGWMIEVQLSDPGELSGLLDAAGYAEIVGKG
ncbi:glycine cleavage system protein GcvH [Nakamurella endophytica]|uniref:Glycine cleavage system H protein n=1 Tax=Nakamurella endophytica TaxID=1748367 RepID=A0A917T786_9ACTN|nr:glycine cleavage system protein GcvH [Nakamurella endophytica]GGM13207.1 glycine cleavage system H protein [Nakamurella endophytica]